MASSHLATTLYLVLLLAFVALVSTIIWGYTSLSNGVTTRRENGPGLRVLARMPGYLAVLAVGLTIASIVIEPHRFISHGKGSIPLNGIGGGSRALGCRGRGPFPLLGRFSSPVAGSGSPCRNSHWHPCVRAEG